MELNVAQRAAGNYLEQLTAIVAPLLMAGSFMPRFAAAVGAFYLVGRHLHTSGFKPKTSTNGRVPGFGTCMLSQALLIVCCLCRGFRMTGILQPFGL